MVTRINSEGLLEFWHSETGAYVPVSVFLQVEGGTLTSLIPEQIALITDIRNACAYLQALNTQLTNLKNETTTCSGKLDQANSSLNILSQINVALGVVKGAIDSL